MKNLNHVMWIILAIAIAPIAGCQQDAAHEEHEQPAHVEPINGSEMSRVTLTPKAVERLDVRTAKVDEQKGSRNESPQKTVPYAAVLYDPHGNTFVYTSPEPRVFIRQQITVEYIEDDVAYLTAGPEPGTEVATVGAAEIYGTEFEVGH